MSDFTKSAARFLGRPLLLHERYARILGDLAAGAGSIEAAKHASNRPGVQSGPLTARTMPEGHVTLAGVALVPIVGALVQRSDWFSQMLGMISYLEVERMITAAVADPEVRQIILDIDSPGGEVAGAFDMADRIHSFRGIKPITAVADEFAASGAYLIASAADQIVLPRTGAVGSVGVVAVHFDISGALDKRGVGVTIIQSGAKKSDGNPYKPLPAAVQAEWQKELDTVYALFVDTVARNLGISAQKVRDTEAGIFMGNEAVGQGLAHRVSTLNDELGAAITGGGASRGPRIASHAEIYKNYAEQMKGGSDRSPLARPARDRAAPEARAEPAAAAAGDVATHEEIYAFYNGQMAKGRERSPAAILDEQREKFGSR